MKNKILILCIVSILVFSAIFTIIISPKDMVSAETAPSYTIRCGEYDAIQTAYYYDRITKRKITKNLLDYLIEIENCI